MADITRRLDPDRWIAEGRTLAGYPILDPSSLYVRLINFVLADERELATHLGRWMTRVAEAQIAQAREQRQIVPRRLAEENLRSLWEETRTSTKPAGGVEGSSFEP